MKVEIGKEEKDETNELPGEEIVEEQPIVDPKEELAEKLRLSELDKARLEGELRGRTATPAQVDNSEQIKQQVWADANGLTDEDFESKWKTPKYKATTALLQADLDKTSQKNSQEMAELRAEQRLAQEFGKEFYDVRTEIDEMVAMASLDVRKDPVKLAKFMRNAYLAVKKEAPVDKKGGTPVNRAKLSGGFEKPSSETKVREEKNDTDEIAVEYRELGRAFGVTSEKERKALMASDDIPMDLGNGMTLVGRELKKNVPA